MRLTLNLILSGTSWRRESRSGFSSLELGKKNALWFGFKTSNMASSRAKLNRSLSSNGRKAPWWALYRSWSMLDLWSAIWSALVRRRVDTYLDLAMEAGIVGPLSGPTSPTLFHCLLYSAAPGWVSECHIIRLPRFTSRLVPVGPLGHLLYIFKNWFTN